jgi:peptidoglycan/LPS O-acetylase OafA/YrhL
MIFTAPHNQPFRPVSYRSEIDGLRALAALAVLLFHFFPEWLPSGYRGVDLFFVISGYVITNLLQKEIQGQTFKFTEFYRRRIKRILPLTFVVTSVTLIAASSILLYPDFMAAAESAFATSTLWANIYFWRDGGYFGGSDKLKPLLHMWSLAVEEQFYIFFPVLLWILITRFRLSAWALIGTLSALALASFIALVALTQYGGASPAFFLMPTRAWQFGIGAIVALLLGYNLFARSAAWAVMAIVTLLFFLWLPGFGLTSQIGVTLSAGIYLLQGGNGSKTDNLLSSPTMRYLGLRSFSIYLWHWPIVAFLNYAFVNGVPLAWNIAGIVLTFTLSELSFRLIERPFRYSLQLKASLWLISANAAAMIAVSSITLASIPSDLQDRLASQIQTNFRCNINDYVPYGGSRACLLKETNYNQNIAILGNSHAQMYAPAILSQYVQTKRAVTLIPLNFCTPTTSLNVSVICAQSARTNLDALLADEKIGIVYIGTTYDHPTLVRADGTEVVDQGGAMFAAALIQLVDSLEAKGKDVRLIGPITTPGFDFASEVSRELRFGLLSEAEARKLFQVPYSAHQAKFGTTITTLSDRLGPAFIRPDKFLCDDKHCRLGDRTSSYFADSNHLGKYGVSVVSPAFNQKQ